MVRVRGTDELLPWVMSHGPYAKVEAPAELRSAVKGWLAGMSKYYRSDRFALAGGGRG
ncbi:MAG: WYL domain-containing protein [Nitrospirae bacterium]|nr:WYL domain-containing protein [Nitrospirota bacterium]